MVSLEASPSALAALWFVAGLVAVAACLPGLFQLLGLGRCEGRYEENPGDLEPAEDDPVYADFYRQLLALGFRPLGSVWEICRFMNGHWMKAFHERAFGSRDRQCFACVYRLVSGEPVRVALVSCFADGAMIWTGNHLEELRQFRDGYVRWGINTRDLAALYQAHREVVDRFVGEGHQPGAHDDLSLLAATVEQHNRTYTRENRQGGWTHLADALFWLGIGPVILKVSTDPAPWTIPAAVIAGGALRAVYWKAALAGIARERTKELTADAPGEPGA